MPELLYWGEGGQFGPFEAQEDGWPNAGQVMRYFREKAEISATEFARLYSEELEKSVRQNRRGKAEKKSKVTAIWILNMEKQNTVPTDMTRRRIIAQLLSIPPALLGLASLGNDDIPLQQKALTFPLVVRSSTLQQPSMDMTAYQKNIRAALRIHNASNAQSLLDDIASDIKSLEHFVKQARGDLLYLIQELLLSNYLLAAKIVRDGIQYDLSYMYANHAVRVAKNIGDDELIAAAKYARGGKALSWGQFGTMQQGRFFFNKEKIQSAICDFQDILALAQARPRTLHPQLQGFTLLQLSRAQGLLKRDKRDPVIVNAMTQTDQAADQIGRQSIDDLYTRLLITGVLSGLHRGSYHLHRANIFNALGYFGKAISELNQLKQLEERTYKKDETRNQVWTDIVMAEAYMGLGNYAEATNKVKGALIACYNIHSLQNVAFIADMHSRLAASSYGTSIDAKELGDMLKEWYEVPGR